jgi:hypothetical protein
MPEISQDVFESLYPAPKPVTAQELRLRANSGGARSMTPPKSSDKVEKKKMTPPAQFRERELSETELLEEFVQGASDQIFGYKREDSHR